MKKFLLGTTALLGAAVFASSALADSPKVTVGGVADFQVGVMSDDLDGAQRAQGFRNDTEVNINVDAKSDNGLGYGAVIDLEADVSGDARGQGVNASRTYLYLEGGWGRVELGSNEGSEDTLKVDASNIARATGGIDGDWLYFANGNGLPYIATPDLPQAHGYTTSFGDELTNNANKITYYSPRFSGFQLGLSYTPDNTDRGQTVTRTDTGLGAGDIFSGGLNYEGQWDQVGLQLAATGSWGDSDTNAIEDISAWNVGGVVSFAGFSFGASYGDWNDSLTVSSADDSDYYTLGAAYDFGPFGASVTWLDSNFDTGAGGDNDFQNLVVGADYKLAEGLTPYAEVSFYELDADSAPALDNDGTVFIVGTELAF